MGCCGGKIKKASNIVKGTTAYYTRFLFEFFAPSIASERYEYANQRIALCMACDKLTWLTKIEYIRWLGSNADEVIANFDNLEALPPLPIKYPMRGYEDKFCSICKCWVDKKAHAREEKCPLGKWSADPLSNPA